MKPIYFLFAFIFSEILSLPLPAAQKIDFANEVKPILEQHCVSCHRDSHAKGKLRLDLKAEALKGGDSGVVIVPGHPEKSPLYVSTTLPKDNDKAMPPKGERLSKTETETLREWIAQGANWPDDVTLKATRRIDFVKDIQPIFELNCVTCHHADGAKGKLRLDEKAEAFKGGEHGSGIVPGNALRSLVYMTTVLSAEHDYLMPPKSKGGPLPKEVSDLLREWIDQGANWPEGITLVPRKAEAGPEKDELPIVTQIHKKILATSKEQTEAEMKVFTDIISRPPPSAAVPFEMIPIPGGEFLMGSPVTEPGHKEDEAPQHKVKIAPFWMGKFEVTWAEYELFMFSDESKSKPTNSLYTSDVADAVSR
ncbi:MAG: SUMF1/EgtB/PvdO family nonheme iron enzyme, partial [Verrucomicrobiota bacterium]|nr:SUMF1/EgtB/PvdO family nonheme iron enzyme [Verrucomicrobiota bacterium]